MNPPFDLPGRAHASPDERRRRAHVGTADMLAAWVGTARRLLKPGGRLGLVHRAEALPRVLAALHGFGDVRVVPVHASEGAPAIRILVTARRGSRAPLRIAPGFVLHEAGGAWTAAAEGVLRGRRDLAP
jgi:tRNA1(Val) A37 N6-methylase TrmN6